MHLSDSHVRDKVNSRDQETLSTAQVKNKNPNFFQIDSR